MAHNISGIIAKPSTAHRFAKASGIHTPAMLSDGYAFLPLSDEHLDKLFAYHGQFDEAMMYLSDSLKAVLAKLSIDGPVAYIETEYFGGAGVQGAVVYEQSHCVYGPISNESGVISEALKHLQVVLNPGHADEFEMIGLSRHRSNDDWIEEGAKC